MKVQSFQSSSFNKMRLTARRQIEAVSKARTISGSASSGDQGLWNHAPAKARTCVNGPYVNWKSRPLMKASRKPAPRAIMQEASMPMSAVGTKRSGARTIETISHNKLKPAITKGFRSCGIDRASCSFESPNDKRNKEGVQCIKFETLLTGLAERSDTVSGTKSYLQTELSETP